MDALDALVDRLSAEFPNIPAGDVRQVVTAAWSMFAEQSEAPQDDQARVSVTEWYARRLLSGAD